MGGFDDHVAIVGDWMPPSPSPRAFLSSMIGDDTVEHTISDTGNNNKKELIFPGAKEQGAPGNDDQNNSTQAGVGGYSGNSSNMFTEPKIGSRGGLMDRIAARAGFNAPRLNTESIRPSDPSKNSDVRSPYLTIPPGLSPTTLLDSPVFLDHLVQPSPTTGKFLFAQSGINQNSGFTTDDFGKGKEKTFDDTSSFAFKPNVESGSTSIPHFNGPNRALGFALQSFPGVKVSIHSDTSVVEPTNFQTFSKAQVSKAQVENQGGNLGLEQNNSVGITENSPSLDGPQEDDGGDPNVCGSQAEDGYNWRKYGQKQVKGSEFPRSYYKCTHPNCPVKKKVERSAEGHITEIIYKGAHNHPQPPPNRRSSLGSSTVLGDMQLDSKPGTGANGDPAWPTVQMGNFNGAANWSQENLDAPSSAPFVQEYGNGAAALPAQNGLHYESGDGVDGSCTFSNDEDDDDRATHGSVSLGYDGEGDELESKRRRIGTYSPEMSGAARAIREPRVVVQTTSEVDILDDGYRWRKYGQKVVKGNPNPRSYYKCTSPGCNVRKHVERASHDLKSVITTYEGKHNHDVPAARNSSHINTGAGAPSVSNNVQRPDSSQLHRSIQRPSLGAFGFPGRPQMAPGPAFGFGINQPGLAGMGMAALGHNPGKFPVMPGHPYFGQPRQINDMGYMLPKMEPKLEPVTDSGLNSSSDGGGGGGSSGYPQFMSRMPLGPQM